MIGTNRDLAAMQKLLDREILQLKRLASGGAKPGLLEHRVASLCRQRVAVCAALVNRRIEASNKVVVFARWVSGNGALGGADAGDNGETMPLGEGWRRQTPL
jgi:low affinity Fe/Cu permease